MHSSRMRTARLLPVSPSMHYSEGVPAWSRGGVPALSRGGVPAWSQGVYLIQGGTYLPGLGWVYLPGLGGGVPAWCRGCTCPCTPPLWTEFLTHASENITLPQTSFAGGKNLHTRSQVRVPPMLVCTYLSTWIKREVWLTIERSVPEVNLKKPLHKGDKAHK